MPIYEYDCGVCGQRQQILQKMSDAPLVDCEACGQAALKRVISATGFALKGEGWYVTDYNNNAKKSAPLAPDTPPKPAADAT